MSIARALSNAMTGFAATARGTEIVAANLANVMTPGYARREVALSPQTHRGNVGGVQVDGIIRHVNAGLLKETRSAAASHGEAAARAAHLRAMEQVIGLPGAPHSLETALSRFQSALSAAAARPDDELRLTEVAHAAAQLTSRFNAASGAAQGARTAAEQAIAGDVATVNATLDRVAYLNRRITSVQAEGQDTSPLQDERQLLVDRISSIVPLQQIARDGGGIALFTREGAVLLDGTSAARLEFYPAGEVQVSQSVGAGLRNLVFNGTELSSAQMHLFAGGSLGAQFEIRDQLAPTLQRGLDALAFELQSRLASPQVDPTLMPGQPGLFIDRDQPSGAASLTGLAGRIALNPVLAPTTGGEAWRIRAGLGATSSEPVGMTTVLFGLVEALTAARPSSAPGAFDGTDPVASRFATVVARQASARVEADGSLAIHNAQLSTLQARQMADGVDSDAEIQRLLQYEQAYAANARVIRAIDEMINSLLRM